MELVKRDPSFEKFQRKQIATSYESSTNKTMICIWPGKRKTQHIIYLKDVRNIVDNVKWIVTFWEAALELATR